jgi:hypothetical protein
MKRLIPVGARADYRCVDAVIAAWLDTTSASLPDGIDATLIGTPYTGSTAGWLEAAGVVCPDAARVTGNRLRDVLAAVPFASRPTTRTIEQVVRPAWTAPAGTPSHTVTHALIGTADPGDEWAPICCGGGIVFPGYPSTGTPDCPDCVISVAAGSEHWVLLYDIAEYLTEIVDMSSTPKSRLPFIREQIEQINVVLRSPRQGIAAAASQTTFASPKRTEPLDVIFERFARWSYQVFAAHRTGTRFPKAAMFDELAARIASL